MSRPVALRVVPERQSAVACARIHSRFARRFRDLSIKDRPKQSRSLGREGSNWTTRSFGDALVFGSGDGTCLRYGGSDTAIALGLTGGDRFDRAACRRPTGVRCL